MAKSPRVARISQEVLDQIAAANDIVEVIGAYFPLKRAGGTYKALCPFHQERSPSFTVNPHRQIFKCFGCGAGGSVFRFVMDYEHLEFGAAARRLAERAGIRIIEEEMTPEDNARLSMRRRLLALHADAADWFHRQLMKSKGGETARSYLKGRGITGEVAKSWRIGYAPEAWDAFGDWARSQRYSQEELRQSGLISQPEGEGRAYDRFRHRVMFPISNAQGEAIAFSGRTLEQNPKAGKYVNSPETILFSKGAVLFGLHRTMRAMINQKSAIVCEGQIDLITAFEAGVQNIIAPQGTAFTSQQAHLLRRYVDEVVLCFDADAAGMKAAERPLEFLLAEGLSVRVMEMPPGEDPDSLIRTQGAAVFLKRVEGARDFFDVQVDRLVAAPDFSTVRGKAAASRKVAEWVSKVSDPLLREAVMNRVTQRLEVSVQEFVRLIRNPSPASRDKAAPVAVRAPTLTDPALRLLALVALHDAEARAWLLEAPWRELLAREAEATLLAKILEAEFTIGPEGTAGLSSFLTTLEADEEATVTTLLDEKPPNHPLTVASDCWNELARRQIRSHIGTLQARLREPGLPMEETLRLNKEILDQQTHLLDIARPFSPPL